MFVIVVYDVEEKRVTRVLKYLREFLNWVQNSVFEGELTEGKYKEMEIGLKKKIKIENDSVIIYQFEDESRVEKKTMGKEKGGIENIL
ncbi:MAG: CRISPR-associated endonuclease Cas2 [Ignavibacteriales bacterium]|nr:CRISPR-associated endonuclease Cas2 [Ignavibacteriales bacterium]